MRIPGLGRKRQPQPAASRKDTAVWTRTLAARLARMAQEGQDEAPPIVAMVPKPIVARPCCRCTHPIRQCMVVFSQGDERFYFHRECFREQFESAVAKGRNLFAKGVKFVRETTGDGD